MRIEKLVVIGVGLIGASCALAVRRACAVGEIVGVGRSRSNLDRALARGVIDRAAMLGDDWTREVQGADFVLIAIPVAQYRETLAALAPALGRDAIVTDAGSTKQDVVLAARELLNERLPQFVPGHPIAGSERSGADAGDASLYVGRQVILTPLPETSSTALKRVEEFWTTCGARVERLDPARHDRILAAVSHLPHLLAFALVAELASRKDSAEYFSNAGSGFRDFTRIAGSSPEMWRDVALANRDALLTELGAYRSAIEALMLSIEHGDRASLDTMLGRAAEARRHWGETATGVGPSGRA
ncbi:MAG TPA: prephenate dehydrogenase/arogenate dehydrogenase family protein [Casimicrobiaceae bacterium]|nr:prephenate dehydrogenase/arogenate dehydrogenase family protein [Casimicrobiaceae bacterium]